MAPAPGTKILISDFVTPPRAGSVTLQSGVYPAGSAIAVDAHVGNMPVTGGWLICPEAGYYMVTWTHRITSQTAAIFPGLYRMRGGVASNLGVLGDLLVTSGEVVQMPSVVVLMQAGDGLRPYIGNGGGTVAGGAGRGYFTAARVA